jgi:hypothetical protein
MPRGERERERERGVEEMMTTGWIDARGKLTSALRLCGAYEDLRAPRVARRSMISLSAINPLYRSVLLCDVQRYDASTKTCRGEDEKHQRQQMLIRYSAPSIYEESVIRRSSFFTGETILNCCTCCILLIQLSINITRTVRIGYMLPFSTSAISSVFYILTQQKTV